MRRGLGLHYSFFTPKLSEVEREENSREEKKRVREEQELGGEELGAKVKP